MPNQSEFTNRLAEWGNGNQTLNANFQQDAAFQSMREIALKLDKTAFIAKVKDHVPSGSDEEKTAFAVNLHRELFNMEPTALLVNLIKDRNVSILNSAIGANVATVLEKQPEFNI
ncbi:hypothetical protein HZF08_02725 [Paenibacillus sp. CGMCC 1.16610]|uniref:Uncharacterized protein n=1 Tax=Paenibacillus anseongense TaxID=2682845 RepID=A0ABW9U824_9BACL|nr:MULTISPECIES: hypothetical protein [Paenibacillus]MBA2937206.1 hypothetical protein [Paenibacillus sp. CGMCC 1.16610]MVQ36267.1 hypothetical protein [Paenibacillus anseongense]